MLRRQRPARERAILYAGGLTLAPPPRFRHDPVAVADLLARQQNQITSVIACRATSSRYIFTAVSGGEIARGPPSRRVTASLPGTATACSEAYRAAGKVSSARRQRQDALRSSDGSRHFSPRFH